MLPRVVSRLTAQLAERRQGWRLDWVWVAFVLAVVVGLVMVFPLWIMLVTAFSGQQRFDTIGLLPRQISVDNFTRRGFIQVSAEHVP